MSSNISYSSGQVGHIEDPFEFLDIHCTVIENN